MGDIEGGRWGEWNCPSVWFLFRQCHLSFHVRTKCQFAISKESLLLYILDIIILLIFLFFFYMFTLEEMKIRTSDLRLMRCGLHPIKLPFKDYILDIITLQTSRFCNYNFKV
jgi:hypothetical protein